MVRIAGHGVGASLEISRRRPADPRARSSIAAARCPGGIASEGLGRDGRASQLDPARGRGGRLPDDEPPANADTHGERERERRQQGLPSDHGCERREGGECGSRSPCQSAASTGRDELLLGAPQLLLEARLRVRFGRAKAASEPPELVLSRSTHRVARGSGRPRA